MQRVVTIGALGAAVWGGHDAKRSPAAGVRGMGDPVDSSAFSAGYIPTPSEVGEPSQPA
jgi:hypothetical protein